MDLKGMALQKAASGLSSFLQGDSQQAPHMTQAQAGIMTAQQGQSLNGNGKLFTNEAGQDPARSEHDGMKVVPTNALAAGLAGSIAGVVTNQKQGGNMFGAVKGAVCGFIGGAAASEAQEAIKEEGGTIKAAAMGGIAATMAGVTMNKGMVGSIIDGVQGAGAAGTLNIVQEKMGDGAAKDAISGAILGTGVASVFADQGGFKDDLMNGLKFGTGGAVGGMGYGALSGGNDKESGLQGFGTQNQASGDDKQMGWGGLGL